MRQEISQPLPQVLLYILNKPLRVDTYRQRKLSSPIQSIGAHYHINSSSLPKMARFLTLPKALVLLWLTTSIVLTHAQSQPWSPLQAPIKLAQKLIRDPVTISLASTDFGHIVHQNPSAIFAPTSISDISSLIQFSNSLPIPFTIAARGQAHSVHGQSMTSQGVVVNMTELNGFRNGDGIVIMSDENRTPLGPYLDVGGEQIWIDVLHATLERGLTPLSWTDYLFLSVGGTLSNAGISGQTFRFGPQISNVHELDVVTGMNYSFL